MVVMLFSKNNPVLLSLTFIAVIALTWFWKYMRNHNEKYDKYANNPILWCKNMGIRSCPKQKKMIYRNSSVPFRSAKNVLQEIIPRGIVPTQMWTDEIVEERKVSWKEVKKLTMNARRRKFGAVTEFREKYAFLSNFFVAEIELKGITYLTSEHAYQASKTTNEVQRYTIAGLDTPGKAKRCGRNVDLRTDWDDIKVSVMTDIVRIKFTTYPELANKLLETGNMELIEGNQWNDRFWGKVLVNEQWIGENHLGIILMEIREELRNKTKEENIS